MTESINLRLSAVIISVSGDQPEVVAIPGEDALPSGRLEPETDRTLELGLRRLVRQQVGIEVGYVEQLYTFGDLGRDKDGRTISIAYLALVGADHTGGLSRIHCYDLFPWEDWRRQRPGLIDEVLVPVIEDWVEDKADRRERADITFGLSGSPWDPTRVLERYELLYEVGLVRERLVDLGEPVTGEIGQAMISDHRRIVATALGRLRGKLSYRPVVFELIPESFTLNQLQQVVEALAGTRLHKPNFRRLVERGGLVEGTGVTDPKTGGRPAELFRFRRDVLRERPAPGVGLPGAR